jgi:CheY-like chemotaxis protein
MNTIVSLSEALCNINEFNVDGVKADIMSIKNAGNTLLDSIDNIFHSAEEYTNKIVNKVYSVLELFNKLETAGVIRIGSKRVHIELNIDDNVSSKLNGDVTKLHKAFLNIISYSAKHTEIGKIRINVSATNERGVQVLHIKFSDTSDGLRDEEKNSVFIQTSDSSDGLFISKSYIEAMNGTIRLESNFGAGTSFYVDIPQKIVGTRLVGDERKENTEKANDEVVDYSQFKILIVDDDELDINVTTRLLAKYKFQITSTTSSLDCIERIKREEYYDMILLDHKMHEVDGVEAMKILKSLNGYRIPRIIALTANAVAGAREYYLNAGFDDYLSKPVDIQELDKLIKRNIQKKTD